MTLGCEHILRIFCYTGCGGLRDVGLMAPLAVPEGGTATLRCTYNLEGDPLYTVKWYKGRQEFFRYVPKEHPNTTVFPLPGVNVDVSVLFVELKQRKRLFPTLKRVIIIFLYL